MFEINSNDCTATDATISCSFESNFMCGYNHMTSSKQLTHWVAVAGPVGVNEGPTVGTTTGTLSGLSCLQALAVS